MAKMMATLERAAMIDKELPKTRLNTSTGESRWSFDVGWMVVRLVKSISVEFIVEAEETGTRTA